MDVRISQKTYSSPAGTTFESQPVAVSWGANRIDLFGIGSDGVLYHQWWDGNSWNPLPATTSWQGLGDPGQYRLTGNPAVNSWGPNRLDIFARDTNGHLWHTCWGGGPTWCTWEDHGGNVTSDASVVSWGPNRLDVFVRDNNNGYEHQAWGGSLPWGPGPTMQDWEPHGSPSGTFASRPSMAAWGLNRLDIFGTGADGNLYHLAWNGSNWSPSTGWDGYGNPGANLVGAPAVATWSNGRLDVFVRDNTGAASHTYSGWWGNYEIHGSRFTADLAEVSWSANRLDIFGRAQDTTTLWQSWNGSVWVPGGWTGWTSLLGTAT
jgi:hypothetical protein